jgi:hypothetical protein
MFYIIKEGFLAIGKQQIGTRAEMKTNNPDMKIWRKQCRQIFSTIEDFVTSKHDPG